MPPSIHYWNYPTEIFCGAEALHGLAQRCALLGMARPLLVTDPGMLELEPFGLLTAHLEQSR
ncbi:MAG: alcohol dehydrogenase, partial [Pseudomonas protegens]